jgi:cAMP-dependent protein kinase regulator
MQTHAHAHTHAHARLPQGISNVFIHCVEKLLLEKPDNPIQFIIDHLSSSYPEAVSHGAPAQDGSVATSLLEESKSSAGAVQNTKKSLDFSDEDDSDEDSDDDISDMQSIPVIRRTRRRTAVSAAVFDMSQVKSGDTKIFEKGPAVASGIRSILRKNILFQHLDEDQIRTVVNAFMPMEFGHGDDIITQGEVGEHFFLLATGEADVYVSKKMSGDQPAEPVKVLTYVNGSGAAFGELALMYNSPRAATVRANGSVKVWALEQTVFRQIVTGSAARRYDQQIDFLRNVKVLSSLSEGERREVASCLKRVSFNSGQVVVRQGDRGEDFYIVESGELLCSAQKSPDLAPEELLRLGIGDYFGEIALLTNRPRQATVTVLKPATLLTVNRATFKRKLGALKNILKRNMQDYTKFVTEHV